MMIRRDIQEKKVHESGLFEVQALSASLVSRQQNAAAFHSFAIAFCATANQPESQPLNLFELSEIQPDCLNPPRSVITEETQNVLAPQKSTQKDAPEYDGVVANESEGYQYDTGM